MLSIRRTLAASLAAAACAALVPALASATIWRPPPVAPPAGAKYLQVQFRYNVDNEWFRHVDAYGTGDDPNCDKSFEASGTDNAKYQFRSAYPLMLLPGSPVYTLPTPKSVKVKGDEVVSRHAQGVKPQFGYVHCPVQKQPIDTGDCGIKSNDAVGGFSALIANGKVTVTGERDLEPPFLRCPYEINGGLESGFELHAKVSMARLRHLKVGHSVTVDDKGTNRSNGVGQDPHNYMRWLQRWDYKITITRVTKKRAV